MAGKACRASRPLSGGRSGAAARGQQRPRARLAAGRDERYGRPAAGVGDRSQSAAPRCRRAVHPSAARSARCPRRGCLRRAGNNSFRTIDLMTAHERSEAPGLDGAAAAPSVEELRALYLLESVKGFGPGAFKALREAGATADAVCERPELLPL